eukprot:Amastigsp_a679866_7.p3 type:complete len:109 gc:universal Amastigsp_a679866_7:452-126(-)
MTGRSLALVPVRCGALARVDECSRGEQLLEPSVKMTRAFAGRRRAWDCSSRVRKVLGWAACALELCGGEAEGALPTRLVPRHGVAHGDVRGAFGSFLSPRPFSGRWRR